MVDMRNKDTFRNWLEHQKRSVLVIIAARSALRLSPMNQQEIGNFYRLEGTAPTFILSTLWGCSTALSVGKWSRNVSKIIKPSFDANFSTNDILKAIGDKSTAISSAKNAVGTVTAPSHKHACISAANAAYANHFYRPTILTGLTSKYGSGTIFFALKNDVDFIENGGTALDLSQNPLWPNRDENINLYNMPSDLYQSWQDLKTYLLSLNQNWEVWTDWYEDRLMGDVPLIENIEIGNPDEGDYGRATFPAEWYKDPAKLNAALKEKIARYDVEKKNTPAEKIAEQTPLAEKIVLNDDGKFDSEFLPVQDLFNQNLQRVSDALAKAIESNSFSQNSDEVNYIQNIVKTHHKNPQRIFDDCNFAIKYIKDLIKKDYIPDSFSTQRLLDTLNQTQSDILAYENKVQQAYEQRQKLINDDIKIEDPETLKTHQEAINPVISEALKREFDSDIKDLATFTMGSRGAAGYRLLSRLSRMIMTISNRAGHQTLSDSIITSLIKAQPHMDAILEMLVKHTSIL